LIKRQASTLGNVRPTTGKILESIRSTLMEYWPEARVLDLFAGTGSLGKAALEEGAREAVFIEGHSKVAGQIKPGPQGMVITGRLPLALAKLQGTFDIILADPPYGAPEGPVCLAQLGPYLAAEGRVVFEHHHKENYPDNVAGLSLWKRRRFGETALSYYQHRQGGGDMPSMGQDAITGQDEPSPEAT